MGPVAVEVGGSTVRIARRGGGSELLAEMAAGVLPGPDALPRLLASLLGPAPPVPVVVHPVSWPAARIAEWPGCPVAAPVASAGRVRRIVVDAGRSGTDVTLVHAGRVVLRRRSRVGGAVLDTAVARLLGVAPPEARRVREALSLRPAAGGLDAERLRVALTPLLCEVVNLVRAVREAGAAPVLLVGGMARSPLLAELLDEAGVPDVEVAPRPEAAAVLGALAFPIGNMRAGAVSARPERAGAPGEPVAVVTPVLDPATPHRRGPGPVPWWLPEPPPTPRRPARVTACALLAAVAVAALLAGGSLLPPAARPPQAAAVPAGVLVQYGYRFDVPAGWEHSGGLPERRRSLLTPAATPESTDLIAVERTPLGYDVAAEPERARAELRATYDAAVSGGSELSGYGPAVVAGRPVTSYRQREGAAVVDWFVVLDGEAQLSVGCRHTAAGERAVLAACAVVVGSVRPA